MRRGLLCLLTLAAALPAAAQNDPGPPPPEVPPPPPEPIQPPYYSCSLERAVPNGTVHAFRLLEPSGRPYGDDILHTWTSYLSEGGVQLHANWADEPPAETGRIDIFSPMEDAGDVYRLQVRRTAPSEDGEDLQWETGLRRPIDGSLHINVPWGPFMGLLAGAPDPRIVMLGADGTVLRNDPIDLPGFASAVALGDSLEPELAAMVADYRNRCELVEGLEPRLVETP